MLDRGTLIRFHSFGSTYTGFIIGTCAYDNAQPSCGSPSCACEDNAYVVRYVWLPGADGPRKPYTIVDMAKVEVVHDYPEKFLVGDQFSATPGDRCTTWKLVRKGSLLQIVPVEKE